ncbi:hypothetical protein Golax_020613, partial [Gossypium laxum]|nr:hypothetical protein [Gossypium laxum]
VEDSIADGLCNILGFRKVYCLGKYLGVPFFHNRITASTLHFVVNKDNVCQPHEYGGLGLQKLQDHNTSFKMKLGCSIGTGSKALWGWEKIRCWQDTWIPNVGPLGNLIPGHSNLYMDCVLSDMVSGNGFGHYLNCGVCGNVSKYVPHVLRACSTARNIWNLLVPYDWLTNFYLSSLQDWLVLNLQGHQDWYVRDIDWKCLFGIIAWRLWKIVTSLFFRGLHGMLTKSSKYHSVMQDSISPTTRKHQSGQK